MPAPSGGDSASQPAWSGGSGPEPVDESWPPGPPFYGRPLPRNSVPVDKAGIPTDPLGLRAYATRQTAGDQPKVSAVTKDNLSQGLKNNLNKKKL
jgi:hypothetical protein